MQVAVDTAASIGDHIVIPGKTDHRIVITGGLLVAKAATHLTFKSGATSISGAIPLDTNAGFAIPNDEDGLSGIDGEGLSLTTDAAVSIAGWILYRYLPVRFT